VTIIDTADCLKKITTLRHVQALTNTSKVVKDVFDTKILKATYVAQIRGDH